jgi:hypothetical protein
VALSCTMADMRSREMAQCPFFSRPSKKQLHACGAYRKEATVVKCSRVRAAQIENVAV